MRYNLGYRSGNSGTVHIGAKLNVFEPELTTYISGLSTPLSSGQKTKLNDFIKALKTGLNINALSDAFDVMYVLGNETAEAGLRNLVKRAHDATAVNSPAFVALEGFKSNGTSSYINTNYNPATQGINYTVNAASIGTYIRQINTPGPKSFFESQDNLGVNRIDLMINRGSSNRYINLNSTGLLSQDFPQLGIHSLVREISTKFSYRNINDNIEINQSTTDIPNVNIVLLAKTYTSGTIVDHNDGQISFFYAGNENVIFDIIHTPFEAYMDSNGKGVIA